MVQCGTLYIHGTHPEEILKGARSRLLSLDGVSEKIIEEAIGELNSFRKDPYGSAYFYWNRASAIKP